MHQFLKFILFWNNILHVSGGLSVHQQEFKTVHAATVSVLHIPVAVCTVLTPDDRRKDRPKRVEYHSIIK
jgi:hypothetical protein